MSHTHLLFCFVLFCFSCSGWSAPCPSSQSCAAKVWTTFSSAVTVTPAFPQPSSLHLHPRYLLPLSPNPPWPMSALPHIPRLTVPTPHCHHTHLLSVPRCPWRPKPSQSLRLSRCNQSRLTVSRSTSSVGLPAASDANTWSKVGQLCQLLQKTLHSWKACSHVGTRVPDSNQNHYEVHHNLWFVLMHIVGFCHFHHAHCLTHRM